MLSSYYETDYTQKWEKLISFWGEKTPQYGDGEKKILGLKNARRLGFCCLLSLAVQPSRFQIPTFFVLGNESCNFQSPPPSSTLDFSHLNSISYAKRGRAVLCMFFRAAQSFLSLLRSGSSCTLQSISYEGALLVTSCSLT